MPPPNFGLPQLSLQPFGMQQKPLSANPMDNLTPEQLAQMFQPYDEQRAALQNQMEYARALGQKPLVEHSTGIGGALGAVAMGLDGYSSGRQQKQTQSALDILTKKQSEADAQKFGLTQALEAEKAKRAAAAKAEAEARARAEWDRQNAVTSKQALQRAHVMAGLQDKRADAADERSAKKDARKEDAKARASVQEIEEKSRNIQTELDKLDKLVDSVGTFELGGSETPEMEAAITSTAIDMAKLRDPGSVAREAEVEMEKKALFTPGVKGLFTSNDTAKELIKKYRERVNQRRDEAYKVRGLTPPAQAKSASGVSLDEEFTPEEEAEYQRFKKANGF